MPSLVICCDSALLRQVACRTGQTRPAVDGLQKNNSDVQQCNFSMQQKKKPSEADLLQYSPHLLAFAFPTPMQPPGGRACKHVFMPKRLEAAHAGYTGVLQQEVQLGSVQPVPAATVQEMMANYPVGFKAWLGFVQAVPAARASSEIDLVFQTAVVQKEVALCYPGGVAASAYKNLGSCSKMQKKSRQACIDVGPQAPSPPTS